MTANRIEPSLSGPGLHAPIRPPRNPPSTPPRRRGGIGRWLLLLLLLGAALVFLPVLAWRWIPPPITAFMLMSPTKPVRYDWVPMEKIAKVAGQAVVAAEDQKFWDHNGFDLEAIEKAVEHNKKSRRKRGASTISQQTAKNLFLWSGGGYFRKGIEAGYTVLIEALWPKERILEVYLNIAEFGPGLYGVEAAARHYFKKPAAALSANEAARLAAVLPSPRRWSVNRPGPYVQKRANWILGQMGYGPRRTTPEDEPPLPPELEQELEADGEPGFPAPAAPDGAPALPEDSDTMATEPVAEPAADDAPDMTPADAASTAPSAEAQPKEEPVQAPAAPVP
jgi:monofunctional biosynthetic peptidoglycan transglycosylase